MKKLLLIIGSVIIVIVADAQTWQQTYGTNGYYGNAIAKTFDKGYLIGGGTGAAGMLMKIDSTGSMIWTKTYAFSSAGDIADVKVASDSNIVTGGYFNSNAGITKLTPTGNISFARQFSGGWSSALITSSNYFLACGHTGSLLRVSNTGSIAWEKFFKYSASEEARIKDIAELTDGNFVGVGSGGSINESIFLVKFDGNGDTLWTKFYGTTGCTLESIVAMGDGTFLASGYRSSGSELLVIKMDNAGNLIWYKGFSAFTNEPSKIIDAEDGGTYIAGATYFQGAGSSDLFLMKLDGAGNMSWLKTYGAASNESFGDAILSHNNNNVVLIGSTSGFSTTGGIYLVSTDTSGNSSCNTLPGTLTSYNITPSFYSGVQITSPTTLTGITLSVNTASPTSSIICTSVGVSELASDTKLSFVYPNPSSGDFKLSLKNDSYVNVTNLLGQSILQDNYKQGENYINLNIPNGIYFINVKSKSNISTHRLIINK